ncbi:Gfo/Idh/MocA family oxidoreductase [uncultured Mucilaginibacter sp.]|uniref:Gfo/Idh/MocA family protein n=1 Tax=uncultured Mucilaginibacter sp. TaxID=797541 RepID=UPI0025F41263|nr:Gfo/Idh/MocA family oxidoreductase [uncultured Mucilaginibacter sp.]
MDTENKPANAINRRKFLEKASVMSAFMIVPRFVLGGKGYTAPSDLINLGFIGTGKQAGGLQGSFFDTNEVKIIAAADVYGAKLQQFAAQVNQRYAAKAAQSKYAGCATYGDFRDLLARKDIDAVVIAVPDHWHSVTAILAARAGKDIYCEKPLSLTINEGRAMVTETRKNNRVFQTGSMQRSWPEFRQAAELVRNGYIGDIQTVKVNVGPPPVPYNLPAEPMPPSLNWDFWLGPNTTQNYNHFLAPGLTDDFWAKWRDYKEFGGGGMTDWGAHMFDIAQWALDMDATGPVLVTPPDSDHQYLTYQYANGITMTHEPVSGDNGVTFIGSKGNINVVRGKIETTPETLATRAISPLEKHVYLSLDHYKDFLQAMRNRTKPVADVEIGHRTATVCNIGNLAYELKRPLHWNPDKEEFINDDEANLRRAREMRKEWVV